MAVTNPIIVKSFSPSTIGPGETSTLTITVQNSNPNDFSAVSFTDTFPSGLVIAVTPNATNDFGGVLTSTAGTGTLSLAGGVVVAGLTSTITVDVTSSSAAVYTNSTGTLNYSYLLVPLTQTGVSGVLTVVCPTITLTPSSFSSGATGQLFDQTIAATGGSAPYTYVVTFGQLPEGLILDINTGEITGFPVTTVSNLFVITATDSKGCTKPGEYTVTIDQSDDITIPAYRINQPNIQDQYNRLQHFLCCLGEKGASLASKLKLGVECCCEENTFLLLNMYWDALVCYDPTPGITNCLTQLQADAIWDDISTKCGICFSPYGTAYKNASGGSGYRLTEDTLRRVTEDGAYRIIE